tara:strand:- start:41 stop:658 length:618 start_codon:yes stop_codon:yes gene_type:complete
MIGDFGKALHKIASLLVRLARSFGGKMWLSLAWSFDGRVTFDGKLYRRAYGGDVHVGKNVFFGPNVCIDSSAGAVVSIGAGTTINAGTFICAFDNIKIGKNVLIGEYCSIRDNDHNFSDTTCPIREQGFVCTPVVIGDGVWLGRNVVIAKGVTIGEGAIIGAQSFVNSDVPAFSIAVGVPAKVKKNRLDGAETSVAEPGMKMMEL